MAELYGEAVLEGAAAGVLAEDEGAFARCADGLGRHDLVGERVDHHAVLVNAGGMGEGIGADDGLVRGGTEGDAAG